MRLEIEDHSSRLGDHGRYAAFGKFNITPHVGMERDDLKLEALIGDYRNAKSVQVPAGDLVGLPENGEWVECELNGAGITFVLPMELHLDSKNSEPAINDLFANLKWMDASCAASDEHASELGMVTMINENQVELFYAGKRENYTWERVYSRNPNGHWTLD